MEANHLRLGLCHLTPVALLVFLLFLVAFRWFTDKVTARKLVKVLSDLFLLM